MGLVYMTWPSEFQSTRPGWGEAAIDGVPFDSKRISIHSPRVGRGARLLREYYLRKGFQSTRPGWGEAALNGLHLVADVDISIHSPRVGRGVVTGSGVLQPLDISIHSPRVGRGRPEMLWREWINISIHSPRVGRGTYQTKIRSRT